MNLQQRAIACETENNLCKPCKIDTSIPLCIVENFVETCGIIRIYGIIIASIIPICALIGIPTILCNNLSSTGWNIFLGIVYLHFSI